MTTATATLLHDIHTLRDLIRRTNTAVHDCDNHYQAGYDTGYRTQYNEESDHLRAIYYAASNAAEEQLAHILKRYQLDNIDGLRAYNLASRYA
jgi:hypothetical protein